MPDLDRTRKNICYLCGVKLEGELDKDHVPPKQFYPENLRRNENLNLFTLTVHKKCNKSYQMDEDYFINSLGGLAYNTKTGIALWKDIHRNMQRQQSKKLYNKILKEFDERPSGLILPAGKILKRQDGKRISRVMAKITRGLFFKENNLFLTDNKVKNVTLFLPGEVLPPEFEFVKNTPAKGQYPDVFDYKYLSVPELNNFQFWAFYLWTAIIVLIPFHHPECSCDNCKLTS